MNQIRILPTLKKRKTLAVQALVVLTAAVFFLISQLAQPAAQAADPVRLVPETFSQVAEQASPAVINISTVRKATPSNFKSPFGPNDPRKEFFERFFGDRMPRRSVPQHSLGTGFIIDASGLAVTNNHVVENAEEIRVTMSDGKEYEAKVLGRDPKTDLALIQIQTKENLPYLTLGDPDEVKIGDWVVAIGNPFGLEHTVTAGILSARGRVIGAGPYDDFLQTDASINPGNSGGPLLNMQGQVIGINTAIVAQGQGIGFAIPADMAQNVVAQLKDGGKVVRGWLGVVIQNVTEDLAKSFDLDETKGALVADVANNGPAEKAGIKRGDVIVGFNGQDIESSSQLPSVVARTPVGERVDVEIVRNGKPKTLNVKVGELKEESVAEAESQTENMGLAVRELTPELAARMNIDQKEGVVVTDVDPNGKAAESGLRPGDVIVEINHKQVKDLADYKRLTNKTDKNDTTLFLVQRDGNTLYFSLAA
jgi:serine protease Do